MATASMNIVIMHLANRLRKLALQITIIEALLYRHYMFYLVVSDYGFGSNFVSLKFMLCGRRKPAFVNCLIMFFYNQLN